MAKLDFTDDEQTVAAAVRRLIGKFPFSPRLQPLRIVLAKLDPQPEKLRARR
jgi:hypothetical protein